jgi:hypothetical protein
MRVYFLVKFDHCHHDPGEFFTHLLSSFAIFPTLGDSLPCIDMAKRNSRKNLKIIATEDAPTDESFSG